MSEMIDIYIGRQPIFNTKMQVIAYELLFRSNTKHNNAVIIGGDAASAQVMMNAIGEMGLSEVVGEHLAFINFTEGLLLRECQPFFPRKRVVIEVLEDIEVTPQLLSALTTLKAQGYTLALDDYVFNPALEPLEAFADIIKVDILAVGPKKMAEHVARIKAKGIKLLAEKVEIREQYDFCLKLGFDYFQGYFFAKPTIISGKRLPNSKLAVLELLASVYNPDVDMKTLSEIVGKDIALSQKLLKFAAESDIKTAPISSIHDAVMRFGLNRLKSWASMLVLSGVDDKPIELFLTSLTRAKFCELLGEKLGGPAKDTYFTVGLFSCLDAVMDSDLSDLVSRLGLEDAIVKALLEGEGKLGLALNAIKGLEQGKTDFELPEGMSANEVSQCYLAAIKFSDSLDLSD
ncbi:MAG: EAL domain-containing protein [Gammaproteobacteria bacterium]|nr:EAL domain-containing protein [Gammaproteobacteria bacterium]